MQPAPLLIKTMTVTHPLNSVNPYRPNAINNVLLSHRNELHPPWEIQVSRMNAGMRGTHNFYF